MGGSNGIKEYFKNNKLVYPTHLELLKGKTIAIDVSGVIHRAKIHSGKKWWLQFINLMHKFSIYNIQIIIVFDGKPPIEKKDTLEERKNKKEKNKITIQNIIDSNLKDNEIGNDNDNDNNNDNDNDNGNDNGNVNDNGDDNGDGNDNSNVNDKESDQNKINDDLITIHRLSKQTNSIKIKDIEICKQMCKYLGIPYIHIESLEADYIFPYLINNTIVDGVYSEDNDMFLLGCKTVYFGLNYNLNTMYEFIYDDCLHNMKITSEQFNNAFIAAGTWNNDNIEYCKFNETIELIKKYNTIENIIENLDKINIGKISRIIKVPRQFDFNKTRELFNIKLTVKVINEINDFINKFQSIFENAKVNCKNYGQVIFNEINILCENNFKEVCKYNKQVKDYYKNRYNIYI